ncbi:DNA-binding protein [Pseudomonas gingeri]|uniref:DNA-binding protein n=1 Tax=Pseudomonas gingeri TaxID=117681 RepID=UPI0015A0BE5B|nr:DNA-binding protein [Pseudomonas gingeri]NWD74965.1 DNA-binding protein [Pseudomonas gingeri]
MAVGVPENDVFAAADAVLARGERPTVERVRLELGRGSPARVGALLDQWWEQLAGRLRGETRLPGLPSEVAQAFVAIWQQATTLAQGVVEQSVAGQRQVLTEESEQLATLEARARLELIQAHQKTTEAIAARQSAEIRLTDLEQLLIQRQTQIEELRLQREDLLAQREDAREQLAEARQQLQGTRKQAEEAREEQQRYTRDVEDRAYREIDRAREESKGIAIQLREASGHLQKLQQTLAAEQRELGLEREQRNSAQLQVQVLTEELERGLQSSVHAEEQRHTLQNRLQRVEGELAETQRNAIALKARAETLEAQLTQLRDTLQSKRQRTRP